MRTVLRLCRRLLGLPVLRLWLWLRIRMRMWIQRLHQLRLRRWLTLYGAKRSLLELSTGSLWNCLRRSSSHGWPGRSGGWRRLRRRPIHMRQRLRHRTVPDGVV